MIKAKLSIPSFNKDSSFSQFLGNKKNTIFVIFINM